MRPGVDYVGVGSGALIFNKKGKILLQLNNKGQWEFPTSAVGFGERRRDAIQDSVKKKLGIDIEVHRIVEVKNHILLEENQHWLQSAFLAQHTGGEIIQKKAKWLRLHEISADELTEKSKSSFLTYVKKHGINAPLFVR